MFNCRNCGALLTNYKCLYCGTEYEMLKPFCTNIIVRIPNYKTLRAITNVPDEIAKIMPENVSGMVRRELTSNLLNEIENNLEIMEEYDPMRRSTMYRTKISVSFE